MKENDTRMQNAELRIRNEIKKMLMTNGECGMRIKDDEFGKAVLEVFFGGF